jgi:hypothetical protein
LSIHDSSIFTILQFSPFLKHFYIAAAQHELHGHPRTRLGFPVLSDNRIAAISLG